MHASALVMPGLCRRIDALLLLQRRGSPGKPGMTPSAARTNMDLGLKDRVAIVTGGNRGIGYAISAGLLNEGAHVVVASLDPARNAQAVEKLKANRTAA